MPHRYGSGVNRLVVSMLTIVGLAALTYGQANYSNQTVKWDDYTFKFLIGGQMAQVLKAGNVVGSILMMNGELQVIPTVVGQDADNLKKSFEDWNAYEKRAHGASASSSMQAPAGQAAAPPADGVASASPGGTGGSASVSFNDGNQPTVVRGDGVTVTFVDEKIRISGYQGANYILRYEKASGSRFLRNVAAPSHLGTSVSGAGEQYLVEGGGVFFDSAIQGVNSVNIQMDRTLVRSKQLSQIALDAVAEVRKKTGHESFTPPGYSDLTMIAGLKLSGDGSLH